MPIRMCHAFEIRKIHAKAFYFIEIIQKVNIRVRDIFVQNKKNT